MLGTWGGQAQAKAEVLEACFNAINDEPEYPGEMPDELWKELNGNKRNTDLALKNTVKLTKEDIIEQLLSNKIFEE